MDLNTVIETPFPDGSSTSRRSEQGCVNSGAGKLSFEGRPVLLFKSCAVESHQVSERKERKDAAPNDFVWKACDTVVHL
jgi:hypothetical protein